MRRRLKPAVIVSAAILLPLLLAGIWTRYTGSTREISPRPADLEARLPRSAMLDDLDSLIRTIEDVHVNPYTRTARADFQRHVSELKAGIQDSLTRREFYTRMAPLVALLNDGHTGVRLPTTEIGQFVRSGGLLFPMEVAISESKLIVVANYSSDANVVPGSELRAINGVAADEIVRNLLRFVSSERRAHRAATVEEYFLFYLWLVYGFEGPFEVAYDPAGSGELVTRRIEGLTYGALQRERKRPLAPQGNEAFSYSYDPETKTGILEILRFVDTGGFATFLRETFRLIRESGAEHLIVDVRKNGGGTTEAANELLRYISDRPVRNFARYDVKVSRQIKAYLKNDIPGPIRWLPLHYFFAQARAIWGTREGSIAVVEGTLTKPRGVQSRFGGETYVLVGPGTFSTASDFAAVVKDYHLGTLIGEETGGLAGSFGDTYLFVLPHSRFGVGVSYKHFTRPSGETTEGGVLPDHHVITTAADLATGHDPVLTLAGDLISRP